MGFPPGHFYSPIPSLTEVLQREQRFFHVPRTVEAIDLNEEGQISTVNAIGPYCARNPFSIGGKAQTRLVLPNDNFSSGDALVYFGLLSYLRPARVVEVGSGYSTLTLLDTLELLGMEDTKCTCVEPFPELLDSLLWPGDREKLDVRRQQLQDIELAVFDDLRSGDILFIDSTHVSKTASDVNVIFFDILPRLASGVYVHFHDIYYPFEYPREWLLQGRAWNEAYILRAFLQYNNAFEICFFSSFLARFHSHLFQQRMPLFLLNPGSGLWLRKR